MEEFEIGHAPDEDIQEALKKYKTIAVVGLSPNPERPSHYVAKYLKEQGYQVIPVNPFIKEVLGEKSYPDLKAVPIKVEVVDIFRRPEEVLPIVEDAIEIGAKVVWMQEGIVNTEAAYKAHAAGLTVIMDRCMMKEHLRLISV
jgi:predicted CoA-binding protein